MCRKASYYGLLVVVTTLVALSGAVQANTVQIAGPSGCSGGQPSCSTSTNFLLVGDNSNPSATGTLSLNLPVNITLPPPISPDSGGLYDITARTNLFQVPAPPQIRGGPPNLLLSASSQPGVESCRSGGCATAVNLMKKLPLAAYAAFVFASGACAAHSFLTSGGFFRWALISTEVARYRTIIRKVR
jgi:hypothetical protein